MNFETSENEYQCADEIRSQELNKDYAKNELAGTGLSGSQELKKDYAKFELPSMSGSQELNKDYAKYKLTGMSGHSGAPLIKSKSLKRKILEYGCFSTILFIFLLLIVLGTEFVFHPENIHSDKVDVKTLHEYKILIEALDKKITNLGAILDKLDGVEKSVKNIEEAQNTLNKTVTNIKSTVQDKLIDLEKSVRNINLEEVQNTVNRSITNTDKLIGLEELIKNIEEAQNTRNTKIDNIVNKAQNKLIGLEDSVKSIGETQNILNKTITNIFGQSQNPSANQTIAKEIPEFFKVFCEDHYKISTYDTLGEFCMYNLKIEE